MLAVISDFRTHLQQLHQAGTLGPILHGAGSWSCKYIIPKWYYHSNNITQTCEGCFTKLPCLQGGIANQLQICCKQIAKTCSCLGNVYCSSSIKYIDTRI